MIKFVFSVLTITEAKQGNRQGESQGGGSSSQVIWPGAHWCSDASVCYRKLGQFLCFRFAAEGILFWGCL